MASRRAAQQQHRDCTLEAAQCAWVAVALWGSQVAGLKMITAKHLGLALQVTTEPPVYGACLTSPRDVLLCSALRVHCE
jgi:hypothetical protein